MTLSVGTMDARGVVRNRDTGEAWSDLVTDGANQTESVLQCTRVPGLRVRAGHVMTIPGVFACEGADHLARFRVVSVTESDQHAVYLTLEPPIVLGHTVRTLPANGAWISVWEPQE